VTSTRPALRDRGLLLGVLVVLAVATTDAVLNVQIVGVYSAGALVASMATTAPRTALVGGLAVSLALLGGFWEGNVGTREWGVRVFLCVLLSSLAVVAAALRQRREARLRRLEVIAETAQRALLRGVPSSLGAVGLATRYASASEDALVGGDLYEAVVTPFGVRLVVGDVRGKGLPAVQTAATVLGAFRQAAATEPDLAALARTVDDVVARTVDDEEFVTLVIVELDADRLGLVNLGHHPPLLITPDEVRELAPADPEPPVGLGPRPVTDRHTWARGDRLLVFTDGLVEARDRSGRTFPLEEHAGALRSGDPGEALDALLARLAAFTGRRLADDLALVLAEHR